MSIVPPRRPTLGAVVTVFGRPEFLVDCLESVLDQTEHFDSVLCVNADPGDELVAQILAEYGGRQRVSVVTAHRPLGVSAALNLGIGAIQTEYVALVDDDDKLHPHAAEVVRKHLATHECVWVSTRFELFGDGGESRVPDWRWEVPFYGGGIRDLVTQHMVASHLKTMHREWLCDRGGFDESSDGCQDWEALLRLTGGEDWCDIPSVQYMHRTHVDQYSARSRATTMKRVNRIRRSILGPPLPVTADVARQMLAAALDLIPELTRSAAVVVYGDSERHGTQLASAAALQILMTDAAIEWVLIIGDATYDLGPIGRIVRSGGERPILGLMALAEWPTSIHQARWFASYADLILCDDVAATLLDFEVSQVTDLKASVGRGQ